MLPRWTPVKQGLAALLDRPSDRPISLTSSEACQGNVRELTSFGVRPSLAVTRGAGARSRYNSGQKGPGDSQQHHRWVQQVALAGHGVRRDQAGLTKSDTYETTVSVGRPVEGMIAISRLEGQQDKAPGVAIVTGANSGIGRATALELAAAGFHVYATVRQSKSADRLQELALAAGSHIDVVEMDVSSDSSVAAAVSKILSEVTTVDVLVNNAGVAGNGVVEESTVEQLEAVMNVNVYGALRCIKAVLPSMRAASRGCVVNVSSVAGRLASLAQAPYVASKWALEGLSEELAFELAPFNIRVAIIEPGVTRTPIFAKNADVPDVSGPYRAHYRRMFQLYAVAIPVAADPFEVARVIHRAVTSEDPKLRYLVGWGAEQIAGGRRRMTDEEWVALGAATDDEEYYADFERVFGIAIAPSGG